MHARTHAGPTGQASAYQIHRAAMTAHVHDAQAIVTARLTQGCSPEEAVRAARQSLRAAGRARVLRDVAQLENAAWAR